LAWTLKALRWRLSSLRSRSVSAECKLVAGSASKSSKRSRVYLKRWPAFLILKHDRFRLLQPFFNTNFQKKPKNPRLQKQKISATPFNILASNVLYILKTTTRHRPRYKIGYTTYVPRYVCMYLFMYCRSNPAREWGF
jgi:hypothetical protein